MALKTNLLLIDLDGVLTDGKFYISSTGEKLKSFHSRDNRAISELIANGYEIHIITASSWEGLPRYSKNLKVSVWYKRDKSYLADITKGKPYYAVGDDVFDLLMLISAEKAFCPKNADSRIKKINGIKVLETNGGEGVIAELVHLLLGE